MTDDDCKDVRLRCEENIGFVSSTPLQHQFCSLTPCGDGIISLFFKSLCLDWLSFYFSLEIGISLRSVDGSYLAGRLCPSHDAGSSSCIDLWVLKCLVQFFSWPVYIKSHLDSPTQLGLTSKNFTMIILSGRILCKWPSAVCEPVDLENWRMAACHSYSIVARLMNSLSSVSFILSSFQCYNVTFMSQVVYGRNLFREWGTSSPFQQRSKERNTGLCLVFLLLQGSSARELEEFPSAVRLDCIFHILSCIYDFWA